MRCQPWLARSRRSRPPAARFVSSRSSAGIALARPPACGARLVKGGAKRVYLHPVAQASAARGLHSYPRRSLKLATGTCRRESTDAGCSGLGSPDIELRRTSRDRSRFHRPPRPPPLHPAPSRAQSEVIGALREKRSASCRTTRSYIPLVQRTTSGTLSLATVSPGYA